jgi:hypothetical protein
LRDVRHEDEMPAKKSKGPPVNAGFSAAMLLGMAKDVIMTALMDPSTLKPQKAASFAAEAIRRAEAFKLLVYETAFACRPCEASKLTRYVSITVAMAERDIPLRVVMRNGGQSLWTHLRNGAAVKFTMWQAKRVKQMFTLCRTLMDQRLSLFDPIIATLLSYQVFDKFFEFLAGDILNVIDPQMEFLFGIDNTRGYIETYSLKRHIASQYELNQLYGANLSVGRRVCLYSFRHGSIGAFYHMGANMVTVALMHSHGDPKSQFVYADNQTVAACHSGRMDVYKQAKEWKDAEAHRPMTWRDSPFYTNNLALVTGKSCH